MTRSDLASPIARANTCAWCRELLPATARPARYCSQRCRQAAFRLRRRSLEVTHAARPLRFAYADPPYPGLAKRYYGREATYAGEVDHTDLIASLEYSYDGWALSTSAKALRDILPLCPPDVCVCPWVKPHGISSKSRGLHNTWEPLIVKQGRREPPGRRDWLRALPARGGGDLMGRKPIAFAAWLFACMGAVPGSGDTLDDLFPGTGIITRAWQSLASLEPRGHVFADGARSRQPSSTPGPSTRRATGRG